jgi:hypothetical protein
MAQRDAEGEAEPGSNDLDPAPVGPGAAAADDAAAAAGGRAAPGAAKGRPIWAKAIYAPVWALRLPPRLLNRHPDVKNELIASIIIVLYAVVGLVAWLLGNEYSDAEANRTLRTSARIAHFNQKQEVHVAFAEGIPQNLLYLEDITTKRLWMEAVKGPGRDKAEYSDGRGYREIAMSIEAQKHLWVTQSRHYMSLCERVRGRFDERIGTCAELIRYCFDRMNDLRLGNEALRDIAESLAEKLDGLPAELSQRGAVSPQEPKVTLSLRHDDLQSLVKRLNEVMTRLEADGPAQRQPSTAGAATAPSGPASAPTSAPASAPSPPRSDASGQARPKAASAAAAPPAAAVDAATDREALRKQARDLLAILSDTIDMLYITTVHSMSEELRSMPVLQDR